MSDAGETTAQRALRTALVTLIAAASAGWVLPLYLALSMVIAGIEKIKLGDAPLASFPFFPEARRMLLVGSVWLLVVAFFWAFAAAYRLLHAPRGPLAGGGSGR